MIWSRYGMRLTGILAGSLLLGLTAQAQATIAEQKELPPLDIKISAASMMVCLGTELPLNMELTNRGPDQIKIDKFEIWNHFQYGYFGERDAGRGGGEGASRYQSPPELVVLDRDKPYESSFKFPLSNEFFKDAGRYSLKLTIEGVSSNEIEFELYNCN